jgi:hypothetical protein
VFKTFRRRLADLTGTDGFFFAFIAAFGLCIIILSVVAWRSVGLF